MKVKSESEVAKSCLTLHDPVDCSLPGSSIHRIFQTRVLEWVAIAFSEFSSSVMSNCLWPRGPQHASPPCPLPTSRAYPNSCPLSWWCHPTISSSVIPLSSCPQSFLASGSFQMSQLFESGGQSIGVSASSAVLPRNTQDWSPLGWTGWISLQSKGLSRVSSNTTVQKHQFFGTKLSSQSDSHIHTWPLEKPQPWLGDLCWHFYIICSGNNWYQQPFIDPIVPYIGPCKRKSSEWGCMIR